MSWSLLRQLPGVCGDGGGEGGADDGVPGREVGRPGLLHPAVVFVVLDAVAEVSQTVGELPPDDGPAVASLPRVVLVDLLLLLHGPLAEPHHQDLEEQDQHPPSHDEPLTD